MKQRAITAVHDAGVNARLRSKQQLLHTLVERVKDQNAYTRARVLQTWMYLAEKTAVPLGHWICVTQIAVGGALCICAAVFRVACPLPGVDIYENNRSTMHWFCRVLCSMPCYDIVHLVQ